MHIQFFEFIHSLGGQLYEYFFFSLAVYKLRAISEHSGKNSFLCVGKSDGFGKFVYGQNARNAQGDARPVVRGYEIAVQLLLRIRQGVRGKFQPFFPVVGCGYENLFPRVDGSLQSSVLAAENNLFPLILRQGGIRREHIAEIFGEGAACQEIFLRIRYDRLGFFRRFDRNGAGKFFARRRGFPLVYMPRHGVAQLFEFALGNMCGGGLFFSGKKKARAPLPGRFRHSLRSAL